MLDIQHKYDSLASFVDAARDGQDPSLSSSRTRMPGYGDWYGTSSFQEALDLAVKGWDGPRDLVNRTATEVTQKVRKHLTPRITRQPGNRGRKVIPSRMAQGHPQQFMQTVRTEGEAHRRTIRILANVSFSASVSSETITKIGAALIALADSLSTIGVSTEIWVSHQVKAKTTYGVAVKIKGYNDPAGVDRLMFAMAHPSMLRRLMFAHMEGEDYTTRRALGVGHGYGIPMDPQVNDETFDVTIGRNVHGIASDPVTWVLEQIDGLGLG